MSHFNKVGIIGIGALGSLLFGFFKKNGFEVYPFEKDDNIRCFIEKNGIEISGEESIKIEPFNLYKNLKNFDFNCLDFLIISVKAYNLEQLFKELPLNSFNTPIVFVQNGLGIEKIYKNKYFRFVSHFAVYRNEKGQIVFKNLKKFNYIGGNGNIEIGKKITKAFCRAGINTKFKKDIKKYIWEKTILNAILNPLCAIFEKNMEDTLKVAGIDFVIKNILKESLLVSKKEGVSINKNFEKMALNYIKKGGKHIPSMVFDKKLNKKTEIDFLNGKISEIGKKHKIQTPVNDFIISLIKNRPDERNF